VLAPAPLHKSSQTRPALGVMNCGIALVYRINAHERSQLIDLQQDADTALRTIRAHFEGMPLDPTLAWQLIWSVCTEQGVRRFHWRRQRYDRLPGKVYCWRPGDIHDWRSAHPLEALPTCHALYLDPHWLGARVAAGLFGETPPVECGPAMSMTRRPGRQSWISPLPAPFQTLHQQGSCAIVRQHALIIY